MKAKKTLPTFKTEKEEAEWYTAHKNELDNYFEPINNAEAEMLLTKLPARNKALQQAKEVTQNYRRSKALPTSIRLSQEDLDLARMIATRKGLPYQTWIKSVIHQAIEKELKATK